MQNENQLIKLRKEKLQKLIDKGINPYPNKVKRTHYIKYLWENKDDLLESDDKVTIAGRIIAFRRQGKIAFLNLEDQTGKIQIFVRRDTLGKDEYDVFKLFDKGDFAQFYGDLFVTRTGEYSLRAHECKLLSKNVKPTPTVKEKVKDGKKIRYDEFSDIELRYRKRYLDLLLNPEKKNVFEKRAEIMRVIRSVLENRGFLEVETPILQPLYGGANARPFKTHHNTLDIDLYLRIATELYLKRLIIGGYERVYEIGKNFRNEGMDRNHNPEFTAIEVYQAYADYNDMMDLTESIFSEISQSLYNSNQIEYQGDKINLERPWKRASMLDLIKEYTDFDASDFDKEKIKEFLDDKEIEYDENDGPGKLITIIFDNFVEDKLIQPTFVTDFPKEVSPLAKSKPGNPKLVERFEAFIAGDEFGNAFTELNDPIDQRNRLEDQAKLRELGDLEANVVDEDFLEALEYGMPPTGGLGLGIDRMVMLFTDNTSIKEIILFPQMRPEK